MSILAEQYRFLNRRPVVPMSVSARHPDDPVIVGARRSPFGRRNGVLAGVHPHDLLGSVHRAVIEDSAIQGPDVDMIITGCVTQVGDQSYNIGRMAALSSGLPAEVPAMTIDSQCGSSQQAVTVAAGLVPRAAAEIIVASGIESMSRVPLGSALGSARGAGFGTPYSEGYTSRFEVVGQ